MEPQTLGYGTVISLSSAGMLQNKSLHYLIYFLNETSLCLIQWLFKCKLGFKSVHLHKSVTRPGQRRKNSVKMSEKGGSKQFNGTFYFASSQHMKLT